MIPLRDSLKPKTFPFITWFLIAANLAAFIWELNLASVGLLEEKIKALGVVPLRLLADPLGDWRTLFSTMYLHGGWSHLIGNMVFLHVFADNVEDSMGHIKFLIFYSICGIGASIAQV